MVSKKALPADIGDFFKGESVFFQPPEQQQPQTPAAPHKTMPVPTSEQSDAGFAHPSSGSKNPASDTRSGQDQTRQAASEHDVTPSGLTSCLQEIDLKQWQEVIENTETQNSALRLTSEERYAVEDVINELRRQYGIKTSMNEVARLGLLLLVHDFHQSKKASLIHQVKKA
jgi:hypothetical protein